MWITLGIEIIKWELWGRHSVGSLCLLHDQCSAPDVIYAEGSLSLPHVPSPGQHRPNRHLVACHRSREKKTPH